MSAHPVALLWFVLTTTICGKFSKVSKKKLFDSMPQDCRGRKELMSVSFQGINSACMTSFDFSREERGLGPKEPTPPSESESP